MKNLNLDMIKKQDDNKKLKNTGNILKKLSLLSYKDDDKCFYSLIAKELINIFNNNLLGEIKLKKFNYIYYRINYNNESYLVLKNNIFSDELISIDEFLNQKLVKNENHILPNFISNEDKEKFMKESKKIKELIDRNYNKQELNSDKFLLNLVEKEDEKKLLKYFEKKGYYDISVLDYLNIIMDDYDYDNKYKDDSKKLFKYTFNNYIVEIGMYISDVISKN